MVRHAPEGEAMSRKFLSYNPMTGLLTTTGFEDGKNYVHYEQDVEAHLDIAAEMRARPEIWNQGVKDCLAHAAFVPDVVIVEMLTKHGVNFYDKSQRKRVLQLIESDYPKLKTTDKRLA